MLRVTCREAQGVERIALPVGFLFLPVSPQHGPLTWQCSFGSSQLLYGNPRSRHVVSSQRPPALASPHSLLRSLSHLHKGPPLSSWGLMTWHCPSAPPATGSKSKMKALADSMSGETLPPSWFTACHSPVLWGFSLRALVLLMRASPS